MFVAKKVAIRSIPLLLLTIVLLWSSVAVFAQDTQSSAPNTNLAPTASDTIFLYYFETHDVLLQQGQSQQYRFSAFAREDVTIVVYGLDQLIVPVLNLYNSAGELLRAGSYGEQPYAAYLEFSPQQDDFYTFTVSVNEVAPQADARGGIARVMLVEGEPLEGDITYLNTINPLLPGRVFMVAGTNELDDDFQLVGQLVTLEVLPVERFDDKPDVFVGVSSLDALPDATNRLTPVQRRSWRNPDGRLVYFYTVNAIPEKPTVATDNIVNNAYRSFNALTFFYFDYFFIVGEGSDPVAFTSNEPCQDIATELREECVEESPTQARTTGGPAPEEEEEEEPPPPPPPPPPCQDVVIFGGAVNEYISGSCGNDLIDAGDGDDYVFGDEGSDSLYGGNGNDTLDGWGGDDYVDGGSGNDILYGWYGNDYLYGADGSDTIYAEDDHDFIDGGAGRDSLYGGSGDDHFIESSSMDSDYINGGPGYDIVDYYTSNNVTFTITGNGFWINATIGTDTVVDVEYYYAGWGNDTFFVNGDFSGVSSPSSSIVLNGYSGTETVRFASGTSGYFTLIGIESVYCNDAVPMCSGGATNIAGFIPSNVWYNVPGTSIWLYLYGPVPAPPTPVSAMAGHDIWELTTASDTPVDGAEGNDTYRLATILGIEVNDTGTSGTDTFVYAVENAALTIEALSDTSYSASDGTNTIFLNGIENIETGATNDIFLLDYDAAGVTNSYDAGENPAHTDRDTAIIQSELDLTLTFNADEIRLSATDLALPVDTLRNFESVTTGNGDDTFVMSAGFIGGYDLNGGAGVNDITYLTSTDLTVNLDSASVMNVTDGLLTDTLTNFSSVTTGSGNDTFNLDINAASTHTVYNLDAGGGDNIFRFFFNGDNPLADTVEMTISADGENNMLDFTGVDVVVNIDLDLRTPQEIFENFIITLEGIFDAVFNPDVQGLPTDLPPVGAESSVSSEESGESSVTETAIDVPAVTTESATGVPAAEVTESAPTDEAVIEATPEPSAEPTEAAPAESTPEPETSTEG